MFSVLESIFGKYFVVEIFLKVLYTSVKTMSQKYAAVLLEKSQLKLCNTFFLNTLKSFLKQ